MGKVYGYRQFHQFEVKCPRCGFIHEAGGTATQTDTTAEEIAAHLAFICALECAVWPCGVRWMDIGGTWTPGKHSPDELRAMRARAQFAKDNKPLGVSLTRYMKGGE